MEETLADGAGVKSVDVSFAEAALAAEAIVVEAAEDAVEY